MLDNGCYKEDEGQDCFGEPLPPSVSSVEEKVLKSYSGIEMPEFEDDKASGLGKKMDSVKENLRGKQLSREVLGEISKSKNGNIKRSLIASLKKEVNSLYPITIKEKFAKWNFELGKTEFPIFAEAMMRYLDNISVSSLTLQGTASFSYKTDYNKSAEIISAGYVIYKMKDYLLVVGYSFEKNYITLEVEKEGVIELLVNDINEFVHFNNCLRRKLFDLDSFLPIKPKKTSWEDVIVEASMKENILDNTLFHMKNMVENNGIILYGEQGSGKSMICEAITNEILSDGYSVLISSSYTDFAILKLLIRNYIGKCCIVFEDVDSYGFSRENVNSINKDLSKFLNFINGIADNEEGIIYIATTNYIDLLDKAIKNRPMRFNRMFKFNFPDNDTIDLLIDKYFNNEIDTDNKSLCHDSKFTGSHIKQLKMEVDRMMKKNKNMELIPAFISSVKIIKDNYSVKIQSGLGF